MVCFNFGAYFADEHSYVPYISLSFSEREILHLKWKKAVERSLGWEVDPIEEPTEGKLKNKLMMDSIQGLA